MNDRELLELAAKAAGYELHIWGTPGEENFARMDVTPAARWSPLTDDGDALRLAVKLRIQVTPGTYNKDEFTAYSPMHTEARERWAGGLQDEYAATRRAIVRAAAEIAKDPQE